ncbi:MAG: hypothetical protein PWQ12_1588 [Clostridiales bacterium]|jgi:nicotinamidase-related amidase|nr:hypothetical protein [Clostridiales bacterium]
MKPALLVIDIQEAFVGHLKGTAAFEKTMIYINEAARCFREAGESVIVVRDISEGTGDNYKTVPEFTTGDHDVEILKMYNNAFWKTDLEGILRTRGVDFVIVCGNAAEYCVLATYNGARERDFGVAMLQHGLFAETHEGRMDGFNNRALISYEVIDALLKTH